MSDVKKNKELVEKFPFLAPTDWNGELLTDYDYSYTVLDEMPDGWREAFGEQMCAEIQECLDNMENYPPINDWHGEPSPYRIEQIKEKYGSLRWYSNWTTDEIDEIIDKYENLSKRTCILCGKPATKMTTGWISPYCECLKEHNERSYNNAMDIDEWFGEF